jgi:hypothetical protein
MRNGLWLRVAAVSLALVVGGGCSTICVLDHPDGNRANAEHKLVLHGDQYIQPQPDPGQVQSLGIHDVTFRDNWFYDVIGVVTLGIYKPYEISYHNTKPGADAGGPMTPPSSGPVHPAPAHPAASNPAGGN